jgi:hypothetical protein
VGRTSHPTVQYPVILCGRWEQNKEIFRLARTQRKKSAFHSLFLGKCLEIVLLQNKRIRKTQIKISFSKQVKSLLCCYTNEHKLKLILNSWVRKPKGIWPVQRGLWRTDTGTEQIYWGVCTGS